MNYFIQLFRCHAKQEGEEGHRRRLPSWQPTSARTNRAAR